MGFPVQVARVFAPSGTNKTRTSVANNAGKTAINLATAITKLNANCIEAPVSFVSDQNIKVLFGTSSLATATALAGVPILARTVYTFWIHRTNSSYMTFYNASGATAYVDYWDPEHS
jgi:hypothetical protein